MIHIYIEEEGAQKDDGAQSQRRERETNKAEPAKHELPFPLPNKQVLSTIVLYILATCLIVRRYPHSFSQ